jgi:lipopolysaccharide export LptBFGC system permease protein LptF
MFAITQPIDVDRADWCMDMVRGIYEQGWQRILRGAAINGYRTFDVSTFPQVSEPPSYFKKEVKQYSEMNYEELRRYIRDLQQSGFDVVKLRVQLNKKLSFPLITLIMAVLAVPFSMSAAKKGAITGVATAVGIAVVYPVVSRLFEAMGDISQLPDLFFALVGAYLILKIPT